MLCAPRFSSVTALLSPLHRASCPGVIAVTEQEMNGQLFEICVSSNDAPAYDTDQYTHPAVLAKIKGGSFAYCDADENYYRSGFGLHY